MLDIENLHVSVDGKEILKGVDLHISPSETCVIMGRNGSGKSTLANAILKNPRYEITKGSLRFAGRDMTNEPTAAIAAAGVFFAQQHAPAIEGLPVSTLLKNAVNSTRETPMPAPEFFKRAKEYCAMLKIPDAWLARDMNVGFSGGEKKRLACLEMLFLEPKLCILDEPDSGVDISSMDMIIEAIKHRQSTGSSFIVISHYARLIDAVKPDKVHLMSEGKIVKSGTHALAKLIEKEGFDAAL
ncbi:MAG: Fe-S cluster assembly ATPase SufC [Rickettsiales bacterium]|jgi:Fe-S cluster assembly ATP-binding protein|nr:Fe-S cluster assembly ATPase SufC [Rickettsiales bacterium]